MTPRPTVSVIVPTFNRAGWLERTVWSALAQTVPPLEVIVVDDGSTDGTEAVARGLPAPVRYLPQANAGVGAARNAGAAAAAGDWLAFLDCEDLWRPEKLEVQFRALADRPGAAWAVSDCTVIGLDDRPLPGRQGFREVFEVFHAGGPDPERHLAAFLERGTSGGVPTYGGDLYALLFGGNICLPSSALVRRDAFEAAGGFDPAWRLAEETEFFHRLAAAAPGVVVMAPLVAYRVGLSGALTSPANSVALIRGALESIERAAGLRMPLAAAEREAFARGRDRLLLRLAYTHLTNYDASAARQALEAVSPAGRTSRRALLLRVLSRVPRGGLRALHRAKRAAGR